MVRQVRVSFKVVGEGVPLSYLLDHPTQVNKEELAFAFGIDEGARMVLVNAEGRLFREDVWAELTGDEYELRVIRAAASGNAAALASNNGQQLLGAQVPVPPMQSLGLLPGTVPEVRIGQPVPMFGGAGGGATGSGMSQMAAVLYSDKSAPPLKVLKRRGPGRKFKKVGGIGYPPAAMGMENMYPSADELAEEEKAVIKIHKAFLSGKAYKLVTILDQVKHIRVGRDELNVPTITKKICDAFGQDVVLTDGKGFPIPKDDATDEPAWWERIYSRNPPKFLAVPAEMSARRGKAQLALEGLSRAGVSLTKRPRLSDIARITSQKDREVEALSAANAEGSAVSSAVREIFRCAICFTNELDGPMMCRHCGQVVACTPCLQRHFDPNGTNESTENLMGRCPLCSALWVQDGVGGIEFKGVSNLKKSLRQSGAGMETGASTSGSGVPFPIEATNDDPDYDPLNDSMDSDSEAY